MRKILKKIITFLKLLNEEFESTCEESYKIKKNRINIKVLKMTI